VKIDLHTHILPPAWPDLAERYGCGGWPQLAMTEPGCGRMTLDGKFFRDIESNCWDPARRLEECDRDGITMQVLSTVPVMFCYGAKGEHVADLAKLLNDHIAETVRAHPQRFSGLGTLPLQDPGCSVRELERCVKELGLSGVEIGSHVNDWNLDAPELFAVFEAAQALNAMVFVHPWDMMARDKMPKYFLPWLVGMPAETSLAICSLIFGGVLERLPRLKVCFAHGGGAFPMTVGRIDHAWHCRPDLCAVNISKSPREYLSRIYVDSLVHDAAALHYLIDLLGADHIGLGSDYPFPLGEQRPGALIESMALDPAVRESILSGTARHLLFTGALV
jgi:aminocarboxymuconate-semialdehyde decarboxylase